MPVQPDAANVLYQSIVFAKKQKLSDYISSLGFECCSTDEFGDAINLSASNARVEQVSVVLSSWGCQFGTWVSGCTTSTGATFADREGAVKTADIDTTGLAPETRGAR